MIEYVENSVYCPGNLVSDVPNHWLHGGCVRTVYFQGHLAYGTDKLRKEQVQADLNAWKPRPEVIYNVALASQQRAQIGPMLVSRGFKLAESSKNPNTGYSIDFYVLDPKDHIEPQA